MITQELRDKKAALVAAGISCQMVLDGTIALHGAGKYCAGGFSGTVSEAQALIAASKANTAACDLSDAAAPDVQARGVKVDGSTYAPFVGCRVELRDGETVAWTQYGRGGSLEFVSGTVCRRGLVAAGIAGSTCSGARRTRWALRTPSGKVADYLRDVRT